MHVRLEGNLCILSREGGNRTSIFESVVLLQFILEKSVVIIKWVKFFEDTLLVTKQRQIYLIYIWTWFLVPPGLPCISFCLEISSSCWKLGRYTGAIRIANFEIRERDLESTILQTLKNFTGFRQFFKHSTHLTKRKTITVTNFLLILLLFSLQRYTFTLFICTWKGHVCNNSLISLEKLTEGITLFIT
jgi:hypothetical protein